MNSFFYFKYILIRNEKRAIGLKASIDEYSAVVPGPAMSDPVMFLGRLFIPEIPLIKIDLLTGAGTSNIAVGIISLQILLFVW